MRVIRRTAFAAFLLTMFAMGRPAAAIPGPYILYFDFGSAELNALSRQRLDEIAAAIRLPGQERTIMVMAGHTDTKGTAALNRRLACERARAAATYLQTRGVPPTRLIVLGYGETSPEVETGDDVREPQNRRVAFTFLQPEQVPPEAWDPPAEFRC